MAQVHMPELGIPVQFSEMGSNFRQPGIYFLYYLGMVVYVGQSVNMSHRITEHADEGRKVFDAIWCKPCQRSRLNEQERLYIERLLPKYNRCQFSQSIRRIWVGHMEQRPIPDQQVSAHTAAQVLGVTGEQLHLLQGYGLTVVRRRVARSRDRIILYSLNELHQLAAQQSDIIRATRKPETLPPRTTPYPRRNRQRKPKAEHHA